MRAEEQCSSIARTLWKKVCRRDGKREQVSDRERDYLGNNVERLTGGYDLLKHGISFCLEIRIAF